jgi:hypothetical protein
MEKDLYVLKWEDSNMIGIFRGSDLSQIDNSTSDMFYTSLKHVMTMYNSKSAKIHILESYDELKKLRDKRNLEQKPTFDEWLEQQGLNFCQTV